MTKGTCRNSAQASGCKRKTWLLLSIRLRCWKWGVEIPSVGTWHRIIFNWQGTLGQSEVSVPMAFRPANSFQGKHLLWGPSLTFLRQTNWMAHTPRWTKECEGQWWVHLDQKSVDGFFSLTRKGFLSHLRNVQIFCLATRKNCQIEGREKRGLPPANETMSKHKAFSRMELTWLWLLASHDFGWILEALKG